MQVVLQHRPRGCKASASLSSVVSRASPVAAAWTHHTRDLT